MKEDFHIPAGGAWRKCAICGKQFFVIDIEQWAYKRHLQSSTRSDKLEWFDKYSCMRAFDRKREQEKKAKREAGVRSPVKKKKFTGKHCCDCAYFHKAKYGFWECGFGYNAYQRKCACGRFKPNESAV